MACMVAKSLESGGHITLPLKAPKGGPHSETASPQRQEGDLPGAAPGHFELLARRACLSWNLAHIFFGCPAQHRRTAAVSIITLRRLLTPRQTAHQQTSGTFGVARVR